ncbi:MAG: hypothetical protein Q8K51_10145 [Nitrospirota bacterium]|nr:hypothetical protein [Nitrospirota bacterium]
MKKITVWLMIFVFIVSTSFLHGCATTPSTPFVKKDISTISPLKVVRYETPEIKVYTLGRVLLGATIGAVLFAGVGAGFGVVLAGGKLEKETPIPDFGQLVMSKFIERVSKGIPNWPAMIIEEQPIKEEYSYKSGTILEFKVNQLTLEFGVGFSSIAVATMKDLEGNVLWEKGFFYSSKKFDRKRSIDEYKADDFKLLKEEIEFAADKTVSDFIEHFKKGEKE